jgi:hypothetical protein
MAAHTTYVNRSVVVLGTTNLSGIFLEAPAAIIDPTNGHNPSMTGMNADWTTAATNCTGWTSNGAAVNATGGNTIAVPTSTSWYSGSTATCSVNNGYICVEQ